MTRGETIQPFLAMEIMERAVALEREGADIVHMEVGEPDFDVPECVRIASERAIREGRTHYTHSLGNWELREEISNYYQRRYAVQVEPEQVIVTSGTSGGLALVMAALLEAGDGIALPNPGYACYPNFVRAFQGSPQFFPVAAEAGFQYSVESIREVLTPRTRGLLLNSPANPTAAIQSRETLAGVAALARDTGIALISDEIYHGLEYMGSAVSVLEVTDDAFVLDGFSKRYAMTGWRIGWLVAPSRFVPLLQRLQQNLFICAGSVAQHAALAALRNGDAAVAAMRDEYERRRSLILSGVRDLGWPVPVEPAGAYYLLADVRHLATDSVAFARCVLEEAHVGITPGIDFGSRAEGFVRFSFATNAARIEEGIARLRRWLQRGVV